MKNKSRILYFFILTASLNSYLIGSQLKDEKPELDKSHVREVEEEPICLVCLEPATERKKLRPFGFISSMQDGKWVRSICCKQLLHSVCISNYEKSIPGSFTKCPGCRQLDIDRELLSALKSNDSAKARKLIEQKANIEITNNKGMTPLIVAINQGLKDVFDSLLKNNADVNHANIYESSPIICAAKMDETEMVEALLDKGANVNAVNKYNLSALRFAVGNNNLEMFNLLLRRGAIDFNNESLKIAKGINLVMRRKLLALYKTRHNALLGAVKGGQHEAVYKAWERGDININFKDEEGNSVLIAAAEANDLSLVQHALILGARAHNLNKQKNSALFYAVMNDNPEMVDILLSKGVDPYLINEGGENCLWVALYANNQLILEKLIDKRGFTSVVNAEGNTPLNFCIQNKQFSMAKFLLDKGANINERLKEEKYTALINAVRDNNLDGVNFLLDNKAKIDVCDEYKKSALDWAAENNNLDMVNILLKKGACDVDDKILDKETTSSEIKEALHEAKKQWAKSGGNKLFLQAVQCNNATLVKDYLKAGANIDVIDESSGLTALMLAVRRGNNYMVECLVKAGADVNALDRKSGLTPLMIATKEKNSVAFDILLSRSVKVNAVDKDRNFALYWAAKNKNIHMFDALLERGAIDFQDMALRCLDSEKDSDFVKKLVSRKNANSTKLFKALQSRYWVGIEACLQDGANVNSQDLQGNTPLIRAAVFNDCELTKNLIKYGASASINAKDNEGWTALAWAARNGNIDLINILLANGAVDVDNFAFNQARTQPVKEALKKEC